MPIVDLSDDGSHGALARGLTQDLLADLTRFRPLEVLHGPAVARDGEPHEADLERARDLDVGYVFQGTLRHDGDRLRVGAQLLEVESGRVPWAETFDAKGEGIFEMQDAIVSRVAGALAVGVDDRQRELSRRVPIGGLGTYDSWLRGMECLVQGTLEADAEARACFQRALDLDPEYARAWAGLSMTYFNEWSCQVWHLFESNRDLAWENALKALELDERDAFVHLVIGRVRIFRRDFDAGRRDLERALVLNPNDPDLLAHLALQFANLGELERALQFAQRARRLRPAHPEWYFVAEALPLFLLGRWQASLEAATAAGRCFVDVSAIRAACLARLGDREGAAREIELFRRDFELKITFGRTPAAGEMVRWLAYVNPMRREQDIEAFATGLRLAGLDVELDETPSRVEPRPAGLEVSGNRFQREEDWWMVAFDGAGARLSDLKGFHDLVRLLAEPGREVHCCDLQGVEHRVDRGEEVLDARARREIEARIAALEEEDRADVGELEALRQALRGATGLGGRSRRLGDEVERARTAVTWRIRSAIKKIGVAHPRLGRHLENSVRTGSFCAYEPETTVQWEVTGLSA